jgi:hypothetical protein
MNERQEDQERRLDEVIKQVVEGQKKLNEKWALLFGEPVVEPTEEEQARLKERLR